MIMGYYAVGLINGGQPAFDNLVAQIERIPEALQITEAMDSDQMMVGFSVPGGMVHVFVDFLDGDITIHAYPN